MSSLWRILRRYSMWDAITTAPRGTISRLIALWTVVWFSVMAGWIVFRVFGSNPPDIPASTAAAFSTFLATGLAGAWGLFRWASGDRRDDA